MFLGGGGEGRGAIHKNQYHTDCLTSDHTPIQLIPQWQRRGFLALFGIFCLYVKVNQERRQIDQQWKREKQVLARRGIRISDLRATSPLLFTVTEAAVLWIKTPHSLFSIELDFQAPPPCVPVWPHARYQTPELTIFDVPTHGSTSSSSSWWFCSTKQDKSADSTVLTVSLTTRCTKRGETLLWMIKKTEQK